jgi:hypothetical protein
MISAVVFARALHSVLVLDLDIIACLVTPLVDFLSYILLAQSTSDNALTSADADVYIKTHLNTLLDIS